MNIKLNRFQIFQKSEQKNQKAQSAQGSFSQTGTFRPEDPEENAKVSIFLLILRKNQKSFIFSFILFFFLFMVFYPPRFLSRLFLNFFIVILLEPQTPEWNPLIPKLRSTDLFFDYKEAKLTLRGITWGTIYIFSLFHFRYF